MDKALQGIFDLGASVFLSDILIYFAVISPRSYIYVLSHITSPLPMPTDLPFIHQRRRLAYLLIARRYDMPFTVTRLTLNGATEVTSYSLQGLVFTPIRLTLNDVVFHCIALH